MFKNGDVFGRLKIIELNKLKKSGHFYHLCICDCGNEKMVMNGNLKKGKTKSCGCLNKEKLSLRAKHNMHGTKEYAAWNNMWTRCTNPKSDRYQNYGGRGICVCKEWENFQNFIADMGLKPSADHSIGRINNDGNYCKENCRWETTDQQKINTSKSVLIEFNGLKKIASQWALEFGMSEFQIRQRYARGIKPPELFCKENFNEVPIEFNGIKKLTTEWMKFAKIPISSFYLCKRKGLSNQEIIKKYLIKNGLVLTT